MERDSNLDLGFLGRILDRIIEQIAKQHVDVDPVGENLAILDLHSKKVCADRMLFGQSSDALFDKLSERNPFFGVQVLFVALEPCHIEQLIDEPIEAIDILHHRRIKLLSLRTLDLASVEGLKIELERCDGRF